MVKTNTPTMHFLKSDVFVAVDMDVSELEIDEGVGGDGEKGDQAGDDSIA